MTLAEIYLGSSGQNLKIHSLESHIWRTLRYAPRDLRCSWQDCPSGDQVFISLQALTQHVQTRHCSPLAPQSPFILKKPGIHCRFIRSCKFIAPTDRELLKHVKTTHLGALASTCYLCSFQRPSFLEMLVHLETKHKIKRSDLPITFFGNPPDICSWPTVTGPVETHMFTVPLVADNPDVSPYDIPTLDEDDGAYDILDEDERDAEIMSLNVHISKPPKGKQRDEQENEIYLATNFRSLTISDSSSEAPIISFHAGLRLPPDKADLSYPVPYRTGEPVVPRRPPPILGNYFRMREALLPTIMADEKKRQEA